MKTKQLVKQYDKEDILEYRYSHENVIPYFVKSVILVISSFAIYHIIHHQNQTISFLHILEFNQTWAFILTVLITILLNRIVVIHKVEYVTVIPNVGIQLKETSGLFQSTQSKLDFIPSSQIIDVIINEGFKGLFVVYYLAIIVKDKSTLSVVLPGAKLTISDFRELRKDIRSKLIKTH